MAHNDQNQKFLFLTDCLMKITQRALNLLWKTSYVSNLSLRFSSLINDTKNQLTLDYDSCEKMFLLMTNGKLNINPSFRFEPSIFYKLMKDIKKYKKRVLSAICSFSVDTDAHLVDGRSMTNWIYVETTKWNRARLSVLFRKKNIYERTSEVQSIADDFCIRGICCW